MVSHYGNIISVHDAHCFAQIFSGGQKIWQIKTKPIKGIWKILGRGYFEIAAMNKFKKNVQGGGMAFPTQKMRSKKCEKRRLT